MPPLNHTTELVKTGYIYVVDIQECNSTLGGDKPYDRDTHYVDSLEAAFTAALDAFEDHPHIRQFNAGFVMLYESHDDGEEYDRAVIRDHPTYDER